MAGMRSLTGYLTAMAVIAFGVTSFSYIYGAGDPSSAPPGAITSDEDSYTYRRLGDNHITSGELEQAEAAYRKALELSRTDIERMAAHEKLARVKVDQNDTIGAASHLKNAIGACDAASPRRVKLLEKYVALEKTNGRQKAAEEEARKILKETKGVEARIGVWRTICELRADLGTVDGLIAECREAGENLEGLLGIAEAYRARRDEVNVRATLERVTNEYPTYRPAREQLLDLLRKSGEREKAMILIEELASSGSEEGRERYAKLLIEERLKGNENPSGNKTKERANE